MNRRMLIASLPALICYSLSDGACMAEDADAKVKFVWHLPNDRLNRAKVYLGGNLQEEPDQTGEDTTRGLPFLLIISAVALLPELAEAVVQVYRDYKDGGVLITSEHGTFQISTDTRLPPDLVIVKSDQGVVVYQAKHPNVDDLLSPMKRILKTAK